MAAIFSMIVCILKDLVAKNSTSLFLSSQLNVVCDGKVRFSGKQTNKQTNKTHIPVYRLHMSKIL